MEKFDFIERLFVMYTIGEERKDLRDAFYNKLIEVFNIDPEKDKLNESAYRINRIERKEAISKLSIIIRDIQKEESLIPQDDFIDLYSSGIIANYTEREHKAAYQNIIRHRVFPN